MGNLIFIRKVFENVAILHLYDLPRSLTKTKPSSEILHIALESRRKHIIPSLFDEIEENRLEKYRCVGMNSLIDRAVAWQAEDPSSNPGLVSSFRFFSFTDRYARFSDGLP